MKPIYSRFCSALVTFVLIISLNSSVKAQPTAPGHIVFTGYQTSGPTTNTDQFSFVPLVSCPVGTIIKFTDCAWNSGSLTFNPNESNATFTVTPATIPAGREVRIILGPPALALFTNGSPAGTVVVTGPISMPTAGEQTFAYIGPDFAPTAFLSGFHNNVETGGCGVTTAAGWDPASCVFPVSPTNNTSMKPATLTTGTNAFWSPVEHQDWKFTGCGLDLSTAAAVRTAVNNPANWIFEDPGGATPSWGVTMSFCAFLGLAPLPVTFESFTGKLNSDKTVTLLWKVAAQQDIQEYIVEESSDAFVFRQLGSVTPGNGNTDSYSYIDMQVANGNNYYRIKIVDLSGKISYSDVVLLNLKAGIRVNVYPNPVTDKLTIQQFGTIQSKNATLSDGRGNILQQIKLTSLQQEISMNSYPAGVYILKMEDGTVFKVVKQ
jgi:hypothetical protein